MASCESSLNSIASNTSLAITRINSTNTKIDSTNTELKELNKNIVLLLNEIKKITTTLGV